MSKEQVRENSDSRIASLKIQDKEYNQMYRQWRIEHKDDYGFYFLDKSDEYTYRNGEGFIDDCPEAEEYAAVNGAHTAAGITLIMYTSLNLLVIFFFTYMPTLLKLPISYNMSGFFQGDETLALILSYAVSLPKRLLPIIYLLCKTKMPLKLAMPLKIKNKPLFNAAIPMAMLVFGINTIFSGFDHVWFSAFGIDSTNYIWVPESTQAVILSAVVNVILIPITSEAILRGAFMTVFRQFGDAYALIITAIISALVTGNIHHFMFSFITALVVGYFSIRTGSVLTAIIMKIIIAGSSYGLTFLGYVEQLEKYHILISLSVVLVYTVFGATMIIFFMKNYSNKINLPLYNMYMSLKDKLLCFAVNPAVLIWIALTIIHTTVRMQIII